MTAYQTLTNIFEQYDADQGASEAHGIASGMLCVDIRADANYWLNELFQNPDTISDNNRNQLLAWFEQIRTLLDGENEQFAFDLLLPDDEDLPSQVIALRDWCRGFLFGVGYAAGSNAQWPGDCDEIMHDIVEFTKLDEDAGGEEDEGAFMEVHEYLRSAVLVIRDQLAEDEEQQQTRH